MKNYKDFVAQKDNISVGFFPGAFKPPHKGHFDTALKMGQQNNMGFVIVSAETREDITSDKSLQIWNIYKKYLPANIEIKVVAGSPVTIIYQIVNILNNGEYKPTSEKALAPLPDALQIADMIKSKGAAFKITVYASTEDKERYKAFFTKNEIYSGGGVTSVSSGDVSRLASATEFRNAIKTDKQNAKNFLPPISSDDTDKIVQIL